MVKEPQFWHIWYRNWDESCLIEVRNIEGQSYEPHNFRVSG